MKKRTIDIPGVYKFGFSYFKKYASFIIGVSVTYFVLAIIPQIYFVLRAPQEPTTESQVFSFILTLIQLFLALGFTKVMLLLIDDKQVEIVDMVNNFRIFLSYFVGSFLFGIAVLIGLFLLILPGIYIGLRLQFYQYYIIEEGDNSFTALKKSFDATENLVLELLLFGLTVLLVNLGGILIFGIGMLVTYPVTTMATAAIYKSLSSEESTIPNDAYRLK